MVANLKISTPAYLPTPERAVQRLRRALGSGALGTLVHVGTAALSPLSNAARATLARPVTD